MRYSLLVWDFDGTLAQTHALALAAFNRLAAERRFRPITDYESARSQSTATLLRKHGISFWRLPGLVRAVREEMAAEIDRVRLVEGMAEVLRELHGRGHRLGVLSSNSEENVRRCFRANGVAELFGFVVGYPRLFGKAKALRRILRLETAERSGVMYVGDEVRDVEAAKWAGIISAAVTWGFNAEELLAASGPTHLLKRPEELLAIV